MDSLINTLLSSLFSVYLPISDVGSRLAISLALSGIITNILQRIYSVFFLDGILNYFSRQYVVTINEDNFMFDRLSTHIYEKHGTNIKDFVLKNESGKNKLVGTKCLKDIVETYSHDDKKYIMTINLVTKSDSDNSEPEKTSIQIRSNSVTAIESYINCHVTNLSNNVSNKIPIYRINIKKTSEKRMVDWNCSVVKLSKNVKNTIVTDTVKKSFYDDVHNFINNEQFYLDRGLPYKRGYILHGEPGCGKTSLIKAIANQYKLPIFIVDLNMVYDNSEFVKLMNDINSHIIDDQKYLVVFEDIDRTTLISSRWGRDNITMDCFLNVLDGLDEYYGRITILTANDISKMRENPALVRAGRIDVIVEIPMCSHLQILSILQFYFKDFDPVTTILDKNVTITPSQLTQLIFTLNDVNKIITAMNKHINFTKVNLEAMNSICYENIVDKNNDETDIENLSYSGLPKIDDTKNRHQKSFARRIKKMTEDLTIYDMKIKRRFEIIDKISESDRIVYDQWLLEKRALEIRLSKTMSDSDIYDHRLSMQKN